MPLMFQPLARYFDFNGRSRRSEYWLWTLFQIVVGMAFGALQGALEPGNPFGAVFAARVVYFIALFIPNLAVGVRRFHDINRTGWWIVFPLVVTIIAFIVYISSHGMGFITDIENFSKLGPHPAPAEAMAAMTTLMGPFLWIYLPALLASLVTLIFTVLDGTAGPKRFGDDPKGRGGNPGVF